jgi:hypothetical protein
MYININKYDANVIQVALDSLYDGHTDILGNAIRTGDNDQAKASYHIQRSIEDIKEEIEYQLKREINGLQ